MPQITREFLKQFKRVTVMGIGRFGGGAGAARYFAQLGAKVLATDQAGAEKLAEALASLDGLGIEFALGGHRREDFTETDLVVANQAVRPEHPLLAEARAAGVAVFTETGLALALNRSPWAAVTGSAGKSTTAALLAAMLQAHDPRTLFGGNIGGDLLTRIEGRPEDAPLVVELSSFQLQHLAGDFAAGRITPPRAAAITNLTPNHLDWHRDMDEYVGAKRNLIRFLDQDGWAILNLDDPLLRPADGRPDRTVGCSPTDPGWPDACYVEDGAIILRRNGERTLALPLADFRLRGRHNVQNALLSVAAAFAMCGDAKAITHGFAAFAGLPHRLETVGQSGGIIFVNDSKATTPEAVILALDAIERPKVLIAGGYDKRSPFNELGAAIQAKAAALVLVGAAAHRLKEAVLAAAGRRAATLGALPIVEAGDDFAAAVEAALRLAPPDGAVLLSPACASYGMFVNYAERGRVFRELAERLGRRC